MPGYLISLDSVTSLKSYTEHGVYATKITPPVGSWKIYQEGTFADYATMRPGDNIYFFIGRKIYGIGELVSVAGECRYLNFPEAGTPNPCAYDQIKSSLLWDEGELEGKEQRWICLFKPAPHFLMQGIDMDDVLASRPESFRMLRAFWKLSFIKFDDEENRAFRDVLLKVNQLALQEPGQHTFPSNYEAKHREIAGKLSKADYSLTVAPLLKSCADGKHLRHEMAIEAGLLYQLATRESATTQIFGKWDYLSHQVIASPFKPIDYMDKMDVFGNSTIPGFDTINKYLVGELKKGEATEQDLEQLMKYVDWVKNEYCYGDYGMIEAFMVASSFTELAKKMLPEIGKRIYTIGHRPAKTFQWHSVRLVEYSYNAGRLDFSVIP